MGPVLRQALEAFGHDLDMAGYTGLALLVEGCLQGYRPCVDVLDAVERVFDFAPATEVIEAFQGRLKEIREISQKEIT